MQRHRHTPRTPRHLASIAAAIAALSVAGLRAPALADASPGRDVRVASTFEGPTYLQNAQSVRCGPTVTGGCQLEFTGTSTLDGSLAGGTSWRLWGWGNPDGSNEYTSIETFTGTFEGCGTGSFQFTVPDGYIAAAPTEPNLGRRMTSTWNVVPGSGTGDLVAVTDGHGNIDGVLYPDQSSAGTFTGVLTCRGHD